MQTTERILLLQQAAREVATPKVREGLERWAAELSHVYWGPARQRTVADAPEGAAAPFDIFMGDLQGILTANGEVTVDDVTYPNPTSALPETESKRNGWQEWRWKDADGHEHRIQALKDWGLVHTSGKRRTKR